MSRPSPCHQIKLALDSVTRLDASRHVAQAAGDAERWIFSHGTYHAYYDACGAFARWAFDEYGIRLLTELRPEMVVRYIECLQGRGLASATLKATQRRRQRHAVNLPPPKSAGTHSAGMRLFSKWPRKAKARKKAISRRPARYVSFMRVFHFASRRGRWTAAVVEAEAPIPKRPKSA